MWEVIYGVVENLILGLWGQGEIGESIIGLCMSASYWTTSLFPNGKANLENVIFFLDFDFIT